MSANGDNRPGCASEQDPNSKQKRISCPITCSVEQRERSGFQTVVIASPLRQLFTAAQSSLWSPRGKSLGSTTRNAVVDVSGLCVATFCCVFALVCIVSSCFATDRADLSARQAKKTFLLNFSCNAASCSSLSLRLLSLERESGRFTRCHNVGGALSCVDLAWRLSGVLWPGCFGSPWFLWLVLCLLLLDPL